jgi:hypothetical protein
MGIDIVSWRLGAAPAYAGGGGLRSGADLVVDRLDVVPPGPLLTPPPSSPEDPRSRAESDLRSYSAQTPLRMGPDPPPPAASAAAGGHGAPEARTNTRTGPGPTRTRGGHPNTARRHRSVRRRKDIRHGSKVTRGLHPTPPSNPGVATPASPKAVAYPGGLVDTQFPAVSDAHPIMSAQSQLSTCEDARP